MEKFYKNIFREEQAVIFEGKDGKIYLLFQQKNFFRRKIFRNFKKRIIKRFQVNEENFDKILNFYCCHYCQKK